MDQADRDSLAIQLGVNRATLEKLLGTSGDTSPEHKVERYLAQAAGDPQTRALLPKHLICGGTSASASFVRLIFRTVYPRYLAWMTALAKTENGLMLADGVGLEIGMWIDEPCSDESPKELLIEAAEELGLMSARPSSDST